MNASAELRQRADRQLFKLVAIEDGLKHIDARRDLTIRSQFGIA